MGAPGRAGSGKRAGMTTSERERLKALERENRELKRANEILRKASAFLPRRSSTADRSDGVVHRRAPDEYGVEPICRQLPIAPSAYYEHKAREVEPRALSTRHHRDAELVGEIRRVTRRTSGSTGAQGLAPAQPRAIPVARCTVERLMRAVGDSGAWYVASATRRRYRTMQAARPGGQGQPSVHGDTAEPAVGR
jgi:putative transposase